MTKWNRPKLIILTKGRSQEYVLTACKAQACSGPNGDNNMCHAMVGGGLGLPASCGYCSSSVPWGQCS